MSDNCALDSARTSNDEELRYVDHRGQETAEEDHQPHIRWRFSKIWESVRPGHSVEKQDTTQRCLVVEKLEAVDFVFALVSPDPDGVDARNGDGAESHQDTKQTSALDWASWWWRWLHVIVRDERDTEAHGDQAVGGQSRDTLFVDEEVDDSNGGGKEDSSDLVEGDGGDLEGEVHADDIHGHGDGERDHVVDGEELGGEHAEGGAGEDVEGCGGDEEVEGGECGLTLGEGGVGEDGFVAEDL